jgi:hypothetical protein
MRTETRNQPPSASDAVEPTIVDLQIREAPRAEDVKGGCDGYWHMMGRSSSIRRCRSSWG